MTIGLDIIHYESEHICLSKIELLHTVLDIAMEFIPILEQNTDICQLDFYMLDHVCKDIRRWLDEGRKVVRVSVNLSRKHMMDVDLLEHIISIVDKYRVPHEYIEIELTETTTDVEFRDLKRVVSSLQQQGIYTSVDDFGMGYSMVFAFMAFEHSAS